MICSCVNLDRFIVRPLPGYGLDQRHYHLERRGGNNMLRFAKNKINRVTAGPTRLRI
jgi:hypothetical protein